MLASGGWSTPAPAQDAAPTVLRQGTHGEVLPELKLPSLIPNADFTDGLQGWDMSRAEGVSSKATVVRANDEHSKNEPVLRVQKTGGIGVVRVVSERIPVQPNTEYVLSGLYHTTTATFGTLAEFRVLEITDPAKPAAQDVANLTITGPTSPSHTGHFSVYNCRPGQWRRRTRTVRTGPNTNFVRLALLVEGPPVTIFFDNIHLNTREKDTREWKFPAREVPLSREETERRLLQRPDARAEVRQENGGPRLYLDGKPRVPFVHLSDVVNPLRGYVKDFADAGMDLHMITLFNLTVKHWTGPGEYDFKKIDDIIWNSVQRDPEGHFIIYINVTAYPEWTQQFPEHTAMNAEGKTATSRHDHHGPPSYYSTLYRQQVMELLRAYVRHMKAQPYARAISGFMLGGGEDGQFYYQVVRGQRTIQDGHSPGDLPLFRDWLRRRYENNVSALRAAWNDPKVTFETARPAVQNEKYSGVFFDPKTQQHELDVQRFLNDEVATLLVDGLTVCKEEMGKPTIGVAYYGRGMSALVYPMFAQNSVMFKSDAVDMMGAQPGYYGWREAGNEGMLNWVFDSTRRHKKIPMLELDFRSWTSQYKDIWHDTQVVRYWNNEDMLGAMARDAGKVLSVGGGAWWMEMTGGWFHDPQIMESIKKIQDAGQAIAAGDGSWRKSEVVFVVDEENYFHTTEQLNIWNGPNYHSLAVQQRAFNRSGVPYDLVYLDDLINENLDDYKVYVFLNLYHASERARNFIETRLKRDGKVLVWQYAPGYLSENGQSVETMQALTGMQFAADLKNSTGLGSAFAAPNAATGVLLSGVAGQKMGLGVDLYAPRFIVEDEAAQPLGTYLSDGKVSSAVKQLNGYKSIFIGHPSGMTPQFIRNIALENGVQPFIEAGDAAMFHRDNFVVVHGVEGGQKTLRLPFRAKVTEMLTGEVLATNSDTIPLDVKVSDTLWLHLEK